MRAIISACSSPSITQGPAMKRGGRSPPNEISEVIAIGRVVVAMPPDRISKSAASASTSAVDAVDAPRFEHTAARPAAGERHVVTAAQITEVGATARVASHHRDRDDAIAVADLDVTRTA